MNGEEVAGSMYTVICKIDGQWKSTVSSGTQTGALQQPRESGKGQERG